METQEIGTLSNKSTARLTQWVRYPACRKWTDILVSTLQPDNEEGHVDVVESLCECLGEKQETSRNYEGGAMREDLITGENRRTSSMWTYLEDFALE